MEDESGEDEEEEEGVEEERRRREGEKGGLNLFYDQYQSVLYLLSTKWYCTTTVPVGTVPPQYQVVLSTNWYSVPPGTACPPKKVFPKKLAPP